MELLKAYGGRVGNWSEGLSPWVLWQRLNAGKVITR